MILRTKLSQEYPDLVDEINTMIDSKISQSEISRKFNISLWRVQEHFERYVMLKFSKVGIGPVQCFPDIGTHGKKESYFINEMDYGSDGELNFKILIDGKEKNNDLR